MVRNSRDPSKGKLTSPFSFLKHVREPGIVQIHRIILSNETHQLKNQYIEEILRSSCTCSSYNCQCLDGYRAYIEREQKVPPYEVISVFAPEVNSQLFHFIYKKNWNGIANLFTYLNTKPEVKGIAVNWLSIARNYDKLLVLRLSEAKKTLTLFNQEQDNHLRNDHRPIPMAHEKIHQPTQKTYPVMVQNNPMPQKEKMADRKLSVILEYPAQSRNPTPPVDHPVPIKQTSQGYYPPVAQKQTTQVNYPPVAQKPNTKLLEESRRPPVAVIHPSRLETFGSTTSLFTPEPAVNNNRGTSRRFSVIAAAKEWEQLGKGGAQVQKESIRMSKPLPAATRIDQIFPIETTDTRNPCKNRVDGHESIRTKKVDNRVSSLIREEPAQFKGSMPDLRSAVFGRQVAKHEEENRKNFEAVEKSTNKCNITISSPEDFNNGSYRNHRKMPPLYSIIQEEKPLDDNYGTFPRRKLESSVRPASRPSSVINGPVYTNGHNNARSPSKDRAKRSPSPLTTTYDHAQSYKMVESPVRPSSRPSSVINGPVYTNGHNNARSPSKDRAKRSPSPLTTTYDHGSHHKLVNNNVHASKQSPPKPINSALLPLPPPFDIVDNSRLNKVSGRCTPSKPASVVSEAQMNYPATVIRASSPAPTRQRASAIRTSSPAPTRQTASSGNANNNSSNRVESTDFTELLDPQNQKIVKLYLKFEKFDAIRELVKNYGNSECQQRFELFMNRRRSTPL